MNNSKLISILRTFSPGEMKEFEKLVSSPFFNKGRNYMPFLNVLKKYFPRFDNDKLTPEYVFSKLYHGKKFNRQIIWNMTSAMQNMAEDFLLYVSVKKDRFARNKQIADELHERKLSGLFNKKMDEMEKELEKTGIGSYYFQYKNQLELGRIHYLFLEDQQHYVPRHITKRGDYTILDFLRILSGVIGDIKSNKRMFNARFETNVPGEFIRNLDLGKIIEYAKTKNHPLVDFMEMYYCSIMLSVSSEAQTYFFVLKELFLKHYDNFTVDERKWWLTALSNYCVEMSDEKIIYRRTLFELNKLQLREIELSRKKDLGKILYIQILRNALAMGEIDWTRKYIDDYSHYLKHSYQKSMRALAFAFLDFKLKEYHKVIEHLKAVKFIDTRDKLFVRSLYIMSYYELGEIPTLHYQIDSTKQFINKNPSIAEHTRKYYERFLAVLGRFLVLKENNNKQEIEYLYSELRNERVMVNGRWLNEKIQETIKR